ncbi:MAG TPA: hemolysin III family protein [Usitatibacter sp.]|nr:hemolysin III family protein [Usitatibacter sp.]
MSRRRGLPDNPRMYYGERLNGYTHLAGTVLALGGAASLVSMAAARGDATRVASFSIYGATLLLTYLASTCYHSTRGRAKAVFRKLDHSAIYLLIAGTYTPFALVSLSRSWGWTLFAASWGLAAVGIVQEICIARGARLTSLAIYVLMGWMGLALMEPLREAITPNGFALLLAGGIVYTVGIVFFLFDHRFRHWHGIWHLCVIAGSALHYATILKFVA